MHLFSVDAIIGFDDRQFVQGINNAENQGRGFASTMAGVGKAVAAAGLAIGTAVVGVGVAAVRVGGEFQQMGNSIRAQTGQSADDVEVTKMAIRDLALETGRFSASEMIAGLYSVSRAGQTTEHQLMLIEQATRLADSSGKEFGTSISTIDALLVKFNTPIEDASKWMNTLAVAQQEMTISQTSMLDGLQRSAGIANAASLSYDFLAAALGFAYQGGQKMQTAATGLTGIFNQMLDPTSNIREAMNELGTATIMNADGTINAQESMIAFIRELDNASPLMQEQIANTMNLSGSNLDLFTNIISNIDALDDQAAMFRYAQQAGDDYARVTEMIDVRTSGLNNQFRIFQIAGQDMLKTIFDIIQAPLADVIGRAADNFRNLAMRMREGGDLYPVIRQLGEAFARLAEFIMNLATNALPIALRVLALFGTALATVLDLFNLLSPAIVPVTIALGAYYAVLKANSLLIQPFKNGIKSLIAQSTIQTKATKAATKAETARKVVTLQQAKADAAAITSAKARATADAYSLKIANAKKVTEGMRAKATALTAKADAAAATTTALRTKVTKAQATATKLTIATEVAQTAATKASTIATVAKTGAMKILNAVMKANPIGALIALVAGLTAGIVALVRWFTRQSEEMKEVRRRTDELIESNQRLTQSFEDSANAHERRLKSYESEARIARTLMSQIEELSAVEDKSAEQRSQMVGLVTKLNEAMGDLNLEVNAETGALNMSLNAINAQIDAREEMARATAAQQRAIEIMREQIELEEQQIAVRQQLKDIAAKMGAEYTTLIEVIGDGSRSADHYRKAMEALGYTLDDSGYSFRGLMRIVRDDLLPAYNENITESERLSTAFSHSSKILAEHEMAQQQTARAIEGTSNSLQRATHDAEREARAREAINQLLMSQMEWLGLATNDATRSLDLFAAAQREMSDTGELSLRTISDMINNGKALALQIDDETGKVFLNVEAYNMLAKARFDEMIAAKQIDREAKIRVIRAETWQVDGLTDEYIELARARLDDAIASNSAVAGYDANIAALIRLRDNIGRTQQATASASRATEQSTQDRQRQAEDAARAIEQARRDEFNAIRQVVDEGVFFERMSAAEIAKTWEDALASGRFAEGTAEHAQLQRNLFTAMRNLYNEQAEIERAYYEERHRIFDAHKDALQRMEAAEQRFTEAVKDRKNEIVRLALEAVNINALFVDNAEKRVVAIEDANMRIKTSYERIEEIEANRVRNDEQLRLRMLEAIQREETARNNLNESTAENREKMELRYNEAVRNATQARDAYLNAELEREKEIDRIRTEIAEERNALIEKEAEANRTLAESIAESLKQTREELKQHAANMVEHTELLESILADTDLTTEMLAELGLLDVGALDALRELAQTCETELNEIAELFGDVFVLAGEQANKELQVMREEINYEIKGIYYKLNNLINEESPAAGENFVLGMIEGVEAKTKELYNAIRNAAIGVIDVVDDAWDINSPAGVGIEATENYVDGLIVGWIDSFPTFLRKIMDTLRRKAAQVNDFLQREGFTAGQNFGNALGQGMISMQAQLFSQAMSVANTIRSAFDMGGGVGRFAPAGGFATGFSSASYSTPTAMLHRAEAQHYRNYVPLQQTSNKPVQVALQRADMATLSNAFGANLQRGSAVQQQGGAQVNVSLNVNGREFYEETFDDFIEVAKRRGVPIGGTT